MILRQCLTTLEVSLSSCFNEFSGTTKILDSSDTLIDELTVADKFVSNAKKYFQFNT